MNTGNLGKLAAERGKKAAELARLIRVYFTAKYGASKVRENLAADYGTCERQAGNWLRFGPPFKHLALMVAREGARFVHHVFHPLSQQDEDARLDARHAALERQLAEQRANLAAEMAEGESAGRNRRRPRFFQAIGRTLKIVRRPEVA